MTESDDAWEQFLDPEHLRGNLIGYGLFISAFELFREAVTEKPRTMYMDGFDENGPVVSDDYKTKVLSRRANSPFYAALDWLQELGAFDEDDMEAIRSVRDHRNEIVHEMYSFVTQADRNLDPEKFGMLLELFQKLEQWWLINFEAAIDPDLVPEGTDPQDVSPGPLILLQLMRDIALGNEPEEGYYLKMYRTVASSSNDGSQE